LPEPLPAGRESDLAEILKKRIPRHRSPKTGDRVPFDFAQGRRDDNKNRKRKLSRSDSSRHNGEHFSRVDGLTFVCKLFHGAGLRRAHFVLHFHGFDDQQAVSSFDRFTHC